MYQQKYSYLSSNSPKNTKLGIKLILSHRFFFWTVRYANYLIWVFMNIYEIRETTQENGIYNSAAYCTSIQNWYQIYAETKLFYSGQICK